MLSREARQYEGFSKAKSMPLKIFHKGKNVMLFATNKIVGLSRAFDLRLLIDAKND